MKDNFTNLNSNVSMINRANIIDQFNINYLLIKNAFIGHSHYEVSSYNLIYSDNQYSIFSTK